MQSKKDQYWVDEAGNRIPRNRLTTREVDNEAIIAKLLKGAQDINARLASYKRQIRTATEGMVAAFMEEKGLDSNGKGNVTLYNFDRSVKVEVSISDRIEFDDLTMKACKEKFDQFLIENVKEKQEFIKEMINDAFMTRRGKLDSKKIIGLMKYETKVKDVHFQQAMNLLRESIRRPDSRTYYRVWVKDDGGEYQNVDLNFSSI